MPGFISTKPPAQPPGAIRDYLPGPYQGSPVGDPVKFPDLPPSEVPYPNPGMPRILTPEEEAAMRERFGLGRSIVPPVGPGEGLAYPANPSPWRDMQGQPMTPQGWGSGQTYYMGNAPWIPAPARSGFGPQMGNLGSLMGSSYRPQIALRR